MRQNTFHDHQSVLHKITFQHENMLNSGEFFNFNHSTHSSDLQCSSEKAKVPEFEIVYSMDEEPARKLPRITDYVNAPPQIQSAADTGNDYEEYGNLPFDFKHYRCEIQVDYLRNQKNVPKDIQYTTLPRYEDRKVIAKRSEVLTKNKRKQKLLNTTVQQAVPCQSQRDISSFLHELVPKMQGSGNPIHKLLNNRLLGSKMHTSSIVKLQRIDFFNEQLVKLNALLEDFKSMNLTQIIQRFQAIERTFTPIVRTQRQIIARQIFNLNKINKNKLNVEASQSFLNQNIKELS